MKLLYRLVTFFVLIYGVLFLHHGLYNQAQKVEDIKTFSAEVKVSEPSLSFATAEYKRFVYVH